MFRPETNEDKNLIRKNTVESRHPFKIKWEPIKQNAEAG